MLLWLFAVIFKVYVIFMYDHYILAFFLPMNNQRFPEVPQNSRLPVSQECHEQAPVCTRMHSRILPESSQSHAKSEIWAFTGLPRECVQSCIYVPSCSFQDWVRDFQYSQSVGTPTCMEDIVELSFIDTYIFPSGLWEFYVTLVPSWRDLH